MDVEIKMPALSTTEPDVAITNWLVEVGQDVKRGQAILEVETDKATMEVESIASGTLKAINVQGGERAAVGQVIAVVEKEGAAVSGAAKVATEAPKAEAAVEEPAKPAAAAPKPKKAGGMFARNKQAAKGDTAVEVKTIALSGAQRVVGKRMQESKQTIPHFYLQTSANAEAIAAARAKAAEKKLAWDAFFAQAVGRAIKKFDKMCYRIEGDKLVASGNDIVGIAVSANDNLYVVPVDDPATKPIEDVSDGIRSMVERIGKGDPEACRIRPGNITISNLGMANVESFIAIVNPPEASLLSIGKTEARAVVRDGKIVAEKRVNIVLSIDHRIINGKYAADFLSEIVKEIEAF